MSREYTGFPISNFRTDVKDLNGQIFGKLKVLGPIKMENRRGMFWQCKCDCGNETIAFGGHLRSKKRVSCGCVSKDNYEKSGTLRLYKMYKRKAEKRNKQFKLELDEFAKLIKSNCYYCNNEPSQVLEQQKSSNIQIIYNGIDRVDSSLGYLKENCVPCCKWCNFSKSNMSYDDWINHMEKILRFQRKIA